MLTKLISQSKKGAYIGSSLYKSWYNRLFTSSMSTYKYTYFDARARGEVPRMLFAQAQVPYDDVRVEEDDWPAMKPSMPFGQIPVLETDGHVICQSRTISRLLAERFGLAGRDEMEKTRADMIAGCCQDTEAYMVKFAFLATEEKNEELEKKWKKEFEEKILPEHFKMYEKLLKENNGGDGWFVGNDVTWADMFFYQTMDFIEAFGGKVTYDNYPKLKAHKERLEKLPRLAEWFKTRPKTSV